MSRDSRDGFFFCVFARATGFEIVRDFEDVR
jgi:hypothetical protein